MHFQYKFKLPIPVEQAWPALMDIRRITPCMPGASIESGEGNEFNGGIKVKLGPIAMTFRGQIHITQRDDAAKVAVIDAAAKEIKGAGAAKATVTLQAVGLGVESEITVDSEFTVSGKPAQFGRGVMEEVGEKLMAEFASRLSRELSAREPVGAVAQGVTSGPGRIEMAPGMRPLPGIASPVSQPVENEALDLFSAAWKPVAKRLFIAVGMLGIIAGAIYVFISK